MIKTGRMIEDCVGKTIKAVLSGTDSLLVFTDGTFTVFYSSGFDDGCSNDDTLSVLSYPRDFLVTNGIVTEAEYDQAQLEQYRKEDMLGIKHIHGCDCVRCETLRKAGE